MIETGVEKLLQKRRDLRQNAVGISPAVHDPVVKELVHGHGAGHIAGDEQVRAAELAPADTFHRGNSRRGQIPPDLVFLARLRVQIVPEGCHKTRREFEFQEKVPAMVHRADGRAFHEMRRGQDQTADGFRSLLQKHQIVG